MSCNQGREHTLNSVQPTRDMSDMDGGGVPGGLRVLLLVQVMEGAEDPAKAQAGAGHQDARHPGPRASPLQTPPRSGPA